jgi:hypothetical protein
MRGNVPNFKMPLWPLPPIVAIVGGVVALTQQKPSDMLIVAVIFGIGLLYYFAYLNPRRKTLWAM